MKLCNCTLKHINSTGGVENKGTNKWIIKLQIDDKLYPKYIVFTWIKIIWKFYFNYKIKS